MAFFLEGGEGGGGRIWSEFSELNWGLNSVSEDTLHAGCQYLLFLHQLIGFLGGWEPSPCLHLLSITTWRKTISVAVSVSCEDAMDLSSSHLAAITPSSSNTPVGFTIQYVPQSAANIVMKTSVTRPTWIMCKTRTAQTLRTELQGRPVCTGTAEPNKPRSPGLSLTVYSIYSISP